MFTSYENHPSILQIKFIWSSSFHVKEKISFSFCKWNRNKKFIIDTISPKLIKVAIDLFTPILTKSINSSIKHNIFPDLAKATLVVPLDKWKPNKNGTSNFRPVSILNTFSKIFEKVMKNQCNLDRLIKGLWLYSASARLINCKAWILRSRWKNLILYLFVSHNPKSMFSYKR